jgi:hypothetical protein
MGTIMPLIRVVYPNRPRIKPKPRWRVGMEVVTIVVALLVWIWAGHLPWQDSMSLPTWFGLMMFLLFWPLPLFSFMPPWRRRMNARKMREFTRWW